jgi:hypothetical protein
LQPAVQLDRADLQDRYSRRSTAGSIEAAAPSPFPTTLFLRSRRSLAGSIVAWTGRSLRYRGARVPAPDGGLHCGWTGAQGLDAIRPRIPAVRREAELRPVGAHRIRAERPACSAVQRRAPLRLEKVALWVKKVWGMFPSFRRWAPLRRQGLGRDLRRQRGCSLCSPAGFHCTAGSIAAK